MRFDINSERARGGLTLMELIVVLVILVALAGIVVPMLPNMLTRSHTSTGATNAGEVNRLVQTYEQLYQGYPSDLDALIDTAGAAVPDYVPNGAGQLSVITLTQPQAAALINSGITRLMEMRPNRAAFVADNNPTFNPYTGNTISIASGAKLLQVSEAVIEGKFGIVADDPLNVGDVYVIFGLGQRCSMVGKMISEPPVHFAENQAGNPANAYGRTGLVFRVTRGGATPTALDRAVFLGAVDIMDDGVGGVNAHLSEYYSIAK